MACLMAIRDFQDSWGMTSGLGTGKFARREPSSCCLCCLRCQPPVGRLPLHRLLGPGPVPSLPEGLGLLTARLLWGEPASALAEALFCRRRGPVALIWSFFLRNRIQRLRRIWAVAQGDVHF